MEYKLNPAIFHTAIHHFNFAADIDLFVNHQLTPYISWRPDPGASFIDAFSGGNLQFLRIHPVCTHSSRITENYSR